MNVNNSLCLSLCIKLREGVSSGGKKCDLKRRLDFTMGVIVSKENRDRTKKVQQTAAVVSALKMASKDAKGNGSPSLSNRSKDETSSLQSQTHPDSLEQRNDKFVDRNDDFDREHMGSLNHDKSSLTYGLPELTDSYAHSSGTTGYWNKSNKAVVTIPYFGAWKNRVSIYKQLQQ